MSDAVTPAHSYPPGGVTVGAFADTLSALFPQPTGLLEDVWPPTQVNYLRFYLDKLQCRTIVVEHHYIDRDYVDDVALFYARSLRAYGNYCRRLHFFSGSFTEDRWRELFRQAAAGDVQGATRFLQDAYLGFLILKPLPGSPVGRTVLKTFSTPPIDGTNRLWGALQPYVVNLAGFELSVTGLPFQQQDRGVSACATTALWSAMQRVAPLEGLVVPTPAMITQAASRYFLADGRALPSEGLSPHQIGEAIRSAGLAPLPVAGGETEQDKAQLYGYVASGFAPVVALHTPVGGHAVCAVGLKMGPIPPQTNPEIGFQDASWAVKGIYIHDDRLGPYAVADLQPFTMADRSLRTQLSIRWPETEAVTEESILMGLIVAVPTKLRLAVTRIRTLGVSIAQWAAEELASEHFGRVVLSCRYDGGAAYRRKAFAFGLSDAGLYTLATSLALSRYVGLVELSTPAGPLLDVLLDATETSANPAVLACVRRAALSAAKCGAVEIVAQTLGAKAIL